MWRRHLHIYPYSRYVREMEISLTCCLGDAGVETLTCNTAASVCVWNPYPKWLHSYSLNLQALLLSLLLVLIFSRLCVWLPAWVGLKLMNLLPYIRLIIFRDTAFLLLCSSILPEFWCKMSSAPWLWSCSNFFPLLTSSTIFLSRDLGTHKTIFFP